MALVWWVVFGGALILAGHWLSLRLRLRAVAGAHAEAERHLAAAAALLRRFADEHAGQMPQAPVAEMAETAPGVTYRSVPHERCDGRLLVLHDAEPRRRVIEFPVLRAARGVWFLNGRTLVVSEEAFDKLVVADDALRAKLAIDVYDLGASPPSTADRQGPEP